MRTFPMLRTLFCLAILLLANTGQSQLLEVHTSSNIPLKINGDPNLMNTFYEANQIRGYFGSRYGDPEDIDFGVDPLNPLGKLHLTIQTQPKLTIGQNGNVGIDLVIPEQYERLTIDNGNLRLINSNRGIFLDGGNFPNFLEGPMITRSFAPFTSGPYQGVGRWGIFLTTARLIFGIPNINNKRFDFASYEDDGSRNVLLTVRKNEKVTRPATGQKDLLPVAIGSVNSDGSILGGSGNFSVTRIDPGEYSITIDDETSDFLSNYLINATVSNGFGIPYYITATHRFSPTGFIIRIFSLTGSFIDQNFHFVVHRLY